MLHHRGLVLTLIAVLAFFCTSYVSADENFRCVTCKEIVQSGFQIKGKFYCKPHAAEALPQCHHCQGSITGKYVAVTHREVPICVSCRNEFPRCFLCSLPVEPARGGEELRDGRKLCTEHAQTAITDQREARKLFRQATAELRRTFGSVIDLPKPVEKVFLVNLERLKKASARSGHNAGLAAGKVLGLTSIIFVTRGNDSWLEPSTIYLLDNVPPNRMLAVCAHEYAHVWHAENHPDYQTTSPIMREGFAEWVAYKVSQNYGRRDQMKLMTNPGGGIYSSGLLKFLALERKRGIDGVLEYARSATTI